MEMYFPQKIHEQAHHAYIQHTGIGVQELREYCLKNLEFFIDITFAYVEGTPPPIMKKNR